MGKGVGTRSSPIYLSDDDDDINMIPAPPPAPSKKRASGGHAVQKNSHKEVSAEAHLNRKRKLKNIRQVDEESVAGPSKFPSAYNGSASTRQPSDLKKRKKQHNQPNKQDKKVARKGPPSYSQSSQSSEIQGSASSVAGPSFLGMANMPFSTDHFAPALLQPAFMMNNAFQLPFSFGFDGPLGSGWGNSTASIGWDPMAWHHPIVSRHPPQTFPTQSDISMSDDHSRRNKTLVTTEPSPPAKPPKKIIGMTSDRDPDGRRRAFKVTPTTIIDAPTVTPGAYTPTISRCLIMEQLPKTHRTPEFIRSWCQRTTDCDPIFLAIEASSASAIIEFPSHSAASNAWASPKLGDTQTMQAKKGSPREDLIRVWWYKPSDPAPDFVVKDLEDGEIEDEAAVKEAAKELKKIEALKEKQAKREKEKEVQTKSADTSPNGSDIVAPHLSALLPHEVYSAMSSASPSISRYPVPVLPLVTPSLPSVLASLPPLIVNNPASILNQEPTPVRTRPPLPPQADLALNWRPPPVPVKTTRKDPYTSAKVISDIKPMDPSQMITDDHSLAFLHPNPSRPKVDHDVDMEIETPVMPQLSISDDEYLSPFVATSSARVSTPTFIVVDNAVEVPPATLPSDGESREESLNDSGTPPPSEPRAMKNAPKGPTFAMRKELEVRLARQRLELSLAAPPSTTSTLSVSTVNVLSEVEKLRMKVMESRKKRAVTTSQVPSVAHTPSVAPQPDLGSISSEPPSSAESPVIGTPSPTISDTPLQVQVLEPTIRSVTQDLDDLAVSLINDTIQAASHKPRSLKEELAAKERLLQQQIEGLKAKLGAKQAKASPKELTVVIPNNQDNIWSDVKENKRATTQTSTSEVRVQWPNEYVYSGILIVSDDECDDDDDEF